ncbi:MAG: MBL fold metallo-hydrolase [Bacteriovoracaceae bacterium]|nr:MBL fold metallo-hydrolase [Bacteriovoracaceae bacterium]
MAFKTKVTLDENFSFEFHYVGHILGAASVIIEIKGKKIAFTGDVGRIEDKVLYPPEQLPQVDYLVTESTYGNRLHELTDPMDDLEKVVNETYARQGVLIIPAFAVGRAQTMMYYLSMLRKQKRIPTMPMYLNSPMATDFTAIFLKHKELHRLTEKECHYINETMQMIKTSEESKSLNHHKGPMVIISASGMVSGGRVLHHLKEFAPKVENTILLTGFQSAGTRGEALQNGVKAIKIHGEYVPVNAQVKVLSNMSSHADYGELISWFTQSKINPKKVFITHGESSAADDLRRRLTETFKWSCVVPIQGEKVNLVG